ncbi:MATN4 protein, partial [Amia calva]|nr:MATN4 protein [Amia calva]
MTGLAIQFAINVAFSEIEGARVHAPDVSKVAIIVTDGRPQDNVRDVSARAKESNIELFAIGVGRVDMNTLRQIASTPLEDHTDYVESYSVIEKLTNKFQQALVCGSMLNGCIPQNLFCVTRIIRPSVQLTLKQKQSPSFFNGLVPLELQLNETDLSDLCVTGDHDCEQVCVSTPGSYKCACREGFTLQEDGKTCRGEWQHRGPIWTSVDQEHTSILTVNTIWFIEVRSGKVLCFMKTVINGALANPNARRFCLWLFSDQLEYIYFSKSGIVEHPYLTSPNCAILFPVPIPPPESCSVATDVVFLIDGSKSVRPENFELVKKFINQIVDKLDVAENKAHVGLVQYSSSVREEFPLGRHNTKKDLKEAVKKMSYMEKGTMTGLALRYLLDNSFTPGHGSRPGAPKVGIVFTDGRSQDYIGEAAKKAKENGFTMYAVGVGNAVEDELREIASDPVGEHYFYTADFKTINQIAKKLHINKCPEENPCECESIINFRKKTDATIEALTKKYILFKWPST